MRPALIAAALLAISCAAVAGEAPKAAPQRPGENEAVCNKEKGLCIVNLEDLAYQQAMLVAATKRVAQLEGELAAEKAKKEKRCAVVVPQREASR